MGRGTKKVENHLQTNKISAGTDKKRRYWRSDDIAEVVIGEFYCS